ncbi:MAG: macro domain-containing protein [Sedimentibacter sp.]|uniref:macro domain-containing protein n=1 Tax=Sedimentibacter sp. TaxID=1960295 RepID=UPI002981E4ED|nr:macro domain-containing protein [Sedimentibacter sp.]MDW5299691.1 macro domain-containing protein [Sedimentibacter sp.]
MLTYIKGDLFSSPAQVLVNTVNTVGVMGKGIALEFKNKYPEMFKAYQNACENQSFDIGKLLLWKKSEKWILLFPTKKNWRAPSQISYIEKGLEKFVQSYEKLGIESIAFPRLGCGNGGLDWNVVKPIIEKYLKPLPIHIYIYVDKYEESTPGIFVKNVKFEDDSFFFELNDNGCRYNADKSNGKDVAVNISIEWLGENFKVLGRESGSVFIDYGKTKKIIHKIKTKQKSDRALIEVKFDGYLMYQNIMQLEGYELV